MTHDLTAMRERGGGASRGQYRRRIQYKRIHARIAGATFIQPSFSSDRSTCKGQDKSVTVH